jgi:1-pyrroline-5-carboxylate dehydrogenase
VQDKAFKLTYSTMFDPPEELHRRFDSALAGVKGRLGVLHPMRIGGEARLGRQEFASRSPIDREWLLARFPSGTAQDVADAVAFLASDRARHINGVNLTVDGGFLKRVDF